MNDRAASLTASLLVRKGTARPATLAGAALKNAAAKVISLNPRKGTAVPAPKGVAEPTFGKKRLRVSLRLDAERHRRFKLAAARNNTTLQSLFVAALDEYLADFPEVGEAVNGHNGAN